MSREARMVRTALLLTIVLLTGACSRLPLPGVLTPGPQRSEAEVRAELVERAREAVPESPVMVEPSNAAARRVWRNAMDARGLRVLVSTESRGLWLIRDSTVMFRAPVAVGMEENFTWEGRTYDFTTPVGRRRVLAKATEPLWVPPDWHYFEVAHDRKLRVVQLRRGQKVTLEDGSHIEVRGDEVGRVNQFGNFWAFTPGTEIIFDGKVFVPPFGTKQRQIPEILGTHKLELGDGYLIHGTNQETSIGEAVSHGCVRMYNEDVAHLYAIVPVGTPVFIF